MDLLTATVAASADTRKFRNAAAQIVLTVDERAALVALTRPTAQVRMALRARIVLAAADGATNTAIAADQHVHVDTVRKWRSRFFKRRLDGLADARRPGRPRRFTDVQTVQVKGAGV